MLNIAKSVINNNPGFQSVSSTGENSSYQLAFRAPQFRCSTSNFNVTFRFEESFPDLNIIQTTWNGSNFAFHQKHAVEYFTPESTEQPLEVEATMEAEELVCNPYSVLYKLDITHPKGVQGFVRTIDDWQPLGYPERNWESLSSLYRIDFNTSGMDPWPWPESGRDMVSYPEEANLFAQEAREMLPRFNEFAILDSLMTQLQINTSNGVVTEHCTQEFTLANGTNAFKCSLGERGSDNHDGGMHSSPEIY